MEWNGIVQHSIKYDKIARNRKLFKRSSKCACVRESLPLTVLSHAWLWPSCLNSCPHPIWPCSNPLDPGVSVPIPVPSRHSELEVGPSLSVADWFFWPWPWLFTLVVSPVSVPGLLAPGSSFHWSHRGSRGKMACSSYSGLHEQSTLPLQKQVLIAGQILIEA